VGEDKVPSQQKENAMCEDKEEVKHYPPEYTKRREIEYGFIESYPVTAQDHYLFWITNLSEEEITRICTVDYPKRIVFVATNFGFITGIIEIIKLEKCFTAKITLFVKDPEFIDVTQKLLVESLADYTTDER
jgi:hypothetical protein